MTLVRSVSHQTVVVAQQVVQRRQSGGRTTAMVAQELPWSLNGHMVVATVITQWMLFVSQRRDNSVTREAESSLKMIHNVYNSTHLIRGDQWPTPVHPFCDHGDACAFLLLPLSDLWATDLLGDLCATVLNMLKTLPWLWRPWRGLNILCATFERSRVTFRPLLCFQRLPGLFWSHPLSV